jgi:hypothetical protein
MQNSLMPEKITPLRPPPTHFEDAPSKSGMIIVFGAFGLSGAVVGFVVAWLLHFIFPAACR